eukprot:TRINITY_DN805_c0_g1_i2.p1 TRINITY_DN805_c0_g1~~TRINITY_DN805_c0_g1_i2.p1  ORF type:complete len:893 (+),score=388.33 TRINITY_DN805_c0_g1_i2:142-2820(+)
MDEEKKDVIADALDQSSMFESLDKNFQEVLNELVGDQNLDRFRVEYEKLFRAVKKSHDSEKKLIKRCREMNAEIITNASKVQTALKLSQDDHKTIGALKKEVDKAWRMVDLSHQKEAAANGAITSLKAEMLRLTHLVEDGLGLAVGQEHSKKELQKMTEELTKQRDYSAQLIKDLQIEIVQVTDRVAMLDSDTAGAREEIKRLEDALIMRHDNIANEQERLGLLDRELREMKELIEAKTNEIRHQGTTHQQNEERQVRLESQLREQKAVNEKSYKEFEQLSQKANKLQQEFEEQMLSNIQLQADKAQRALEIKARQDDIDGLEQRELSSGRARAQLAKQKKDLEEQVKSAEDGKQALRVEIQRLEKEVENFNKQETVDRRQFEELQHERDLTNKNLVKVSEKQQKQVDAVMISEGAIQNLEQEIAGHKKHSQEQRKVIFDLENHREALVREASAATERYLQALEEVKLRELTIDEKQKRIAEIEGKLKQQQTLYEAVRSDRNMYSKSCFEAQEEIEEMRRKFKIMAKQIEQLKDEVFKKDREFMREHFELQKVEKEHAAYLNENKALENEIKHFSDLITQNQTDIQKLNQIINELEVDRLNQVKQLQQHKRERDLIGGQIIRREEEIALVMEKIRLLESSLRRGETQYTERNQDIEAFKGKIRQQALKHQEVTNQAAKADQLQETKFSLERMLLTEQTKARSLADDLQAPMNIHRWRKLEGSDSKAYELIQKLGVLQKRLITRMEEFAAREFQLGETGTELAKLEADARRRGGVDIVQALEEAKESLRKKTKKTEDLTRKLENIEEETRETQSELYRQQQELQNVQRKFYDQKKAVEKKSQAEAAEMVTTKVVPLNTAKPKILAGGFQVRAAINPAKPKELDGLTSSFGATK